jgi:hypothetical protein
MGIGPTLFGHLVQCGIGGVLKMQDQKMQDLKMTDHLVLHFLVLHFERPQVHIAPGNQTGLGRYPCSIERISSSVQNGYKICVCVLRIHLQDNVYSAGCGEMSSPPKP